MKHRVHSTLAQRIPVPARRQLGVRGTLALSIALAALLVGLLFIAFAPPAGATETPHPATTSAPHGEEDDGCDHGATGKPCKDDPEPDHGKDCEQHGNHGGINEDHCATGTPTTGTPTTGTPTTGTPTGTTSTTTPYSPSSTSTGTHTRNPVTPSTTRHTVRPTGGIKAPVKVKPRRTVDAPPAAAPTPQAPELAHTGPITPAALWAGIAALLLGAGAYLLMPRTRRH